MDSAAARNTARSHTIAPRELQLDIPGETPRYWMADDPYSTHLMNVLSLSFPPGERFFIDAVRAFRDQITDPALAEQVRGFVQQEALHSREHTRFNRWLRRFGIDGDAWERGISSEIAQRRKRRTPLDDLAVTCALEHFTALMAEGWLTQRGLREGAVEPLRTLWSWHAIEELDHKSVAFDVYHHVSGDYLRRVRWMASISFGFVVGVSLAHVQLMSADRQFERPLQVARSWWRYWGPRGHFTRLIPSYLRYFRPDFHPWHEDHRPLIARAYAELSGRRAPG